MESNDVLSPSESGKFIIERSKLVKINKEGVNKVAKQILLAAKDGSIQQAEFSAHHLHPKSADKDAIQWVFFIDAINFSFWPDENKKYDVSYNGKTYTGYFAACAAVNRAIDAGIPILSADWMVKIGEAKLDEIFLSNSGHSIPLLKERTEVIHQIGKVLLEHFDGQFYNCVLKANRSAQKLLSLIVEYFPCFRDFAVYENQKVSLLKRAQILVADVYGALHGKDPVADFQDINTLTMFADYRVPQALNFLGALKYSDDLLQLLNSKKYLENGSTAEVELRGASIAVCDQIVDEMNRLRQEDDEFKGVREVNAMEVDVYTWVYRREHAEEVEAKVPFHRTRCIYY